MMAMVETLGAKPVAAAYSEVYSALQDGIVDAAENSLVNYLEQGCYDVAPYFIADHHIGMADLLVMSEKTKRKLSAADLQIIEETALASWAYRQQLWAEAETAAKAEIKEKNIMLIELSETVPAVFRSACEPMWYEYENEKYRELAAQIAQS